jgi:hypothetical protein
MPQLAVTELMAATISSIPIPSFAGVSILEFAFPPRGSALRLLLCDGRFAVDTGSAFDMGEAGRRAENGTKLLV